MRQTNLLDIIFLPKTKQLLYYSAISCLCWGKEWGSHIQDESEMGGQTLGMDSTYRNHRTSSYKHRFGKFNDHFSWYSQIFLFYFSRKTAKASVGLLLTLKHVLNAVISVSSEAVLPCWSCALFVCSGKLWELLQYVVRNPNFLPFCYREHYNMDGLIGR
jgi:hypothetical protein